MSNIAKYQIVERAIRDSINSGELSTGDQLMTEEDLCRKYGFSRTTIGKALDNLRTSGYIERIPGKGTFVRASRVEKSASSGRSFSEDMEAIGMTASAKLISYEVHRAHEVPEIAAKLKLHDDDLVHHFVRLRMGDGRPIAIGDTYVSGTVIPAISIECLDNSFYDYVKTLGLTILAPSKRLSAALPTAQQQELLGATDIALLCSSHVTYTQKEGELIPFEYTDTYYNGDLYAYTVESTEKLEHVGD